ncbi:MAG: spore coat protein [Oscillospiraceae bacterium]|nr:spore coat protein [Oscillospiraceae bacterium]
MSDQEWITDLLLGEKKMSGNYDTYASECVNTQLRDQFLQILTQGHDTQTELFNKAKGKGWYQVDQAPASKISSACQKFSGNIPSIS